MNNVVLLGIPGLVLGTGVAYYVPRWRLIAPAAVLGMVATGYVFQKADAWFEDQSGDDIPNVGAIALITNLAGVAVGLLLGLALARVTKRGMRS